MGDAARRKAMGLYPDTSKPKEAEVVVGRMQTRRVLACADCKMPGFTMVDSPRGKVHAPGDCDRARGRRAAQKDWEAKQGKVKAVPK